MTGSTNTQNSRSLRTEGGRFPPGRIQQRQPALHPLVRRRLHRTDQAPGLRGGKGVAAAGRQPPGRYRNADGLEFRALQGAWPCSLLCRQRRADARNLHPRLCRSSGSSTTATSSPSSRRASLLANTGVSWIACCELPAFVLARGRWRRPRFDRGARYFVRGSLHLRGASRGRPAGSRSRFAGVSRGSRGTCRALGSRSLPRWCRGEAWRLGVRARAFRRS